VIGNAVQIMRIATGEVDDEKHDPAKEHMRRGGLAAPRDEAGHADGVVLAVEAAFGLADLVCNAARLRASYTTRPDCSPRSRSP
jgi:hypothetical protein